MSLDSFDVSPEAAADVAALEAKEALKWSTIAEAKNLRSRWTETARAMDDMLEKYDANPNDQTEATLLVVFSGLLAEGFLTDAGRAAVRLKELLPDAA